jgi:myo-inositol 2-dehydrogenase/D-chiro-inositol 1-dehydrogenase
MAKSVKPLRDLSRRQFLARSAGLAGASLGLGVSCRELTAAGHQGREVRLAFIGLGDRGGQLLGSALRLPGARVVGVADVDPAHLRRAADVARDHQPRLASDPRILLEDPQVEAVFIASPVYLHREHALQALQAGKHVYLEKPMALTVEDCRAVEEAAREAEGRGQTFQIGFQRRYSPRYQASIEAIRRGDAGRILFVRAQWHSTGGPARGKKPWYYRRDKSGDIVVEQACHQMDVFNWVFGAQPLLACGLGGSNLPGEEPFLREGAHKESHRKDAGIRDHYGLVLEYPGGGKVHYSHLSYAIPDRRFAGVYELCFGEKLGIDLANAIAWDRSGKTMELSAAGGNDTQLAVEAFLRSVRTGAEPAAGHAVGAQATLASLLALKALDSGRTERLSDLA